MTLKKKTLRRRRKKLGTCRQASKAPRPPDFLAHRITMLCNIPFFLRSVQVYKLRARRNCRLQPMVEGSPVPLNAMSIFNWTYFTVILGWIVARGLRFDTWCLGVARRPLKGPAVQIHKKQKTKNKKIKIFTR
jgi:hypothetical protein